MNIYCFDLTRGVSTEDALPLLSEQRAAYCAKIKNPVPLRQSVFAYLLLRYALKAEYGITKAPEFIFGEHGKPLLSGRNDIFFSMSHIKTAAVCAAASFPVGADVQDERRLRLSAAEKFCTKSELAKAYSLGEREAQRYLCRIWSIKESFSKMTGNGFSEGFCGISAEELLSKKQAAAAEYCGNFVSACSSGVIERLDIIDVGEEILEP